MPSTQFIHVAQFFETIFCFALLILIGQRFIMTWNNLDEKYMQQRMKQLHEELEWQRKKVVSAAQTSHQPQIMQQQNKQKQEVKPPQQEHLKSSLVQNQHDQTDRKISQNNQQGKTYKRKSLTELYKQQERNSKQIQIKDQSDAATQRNKSIQIKQHDNQGNNRNSDIQKPQFLDLNNLQPSITSNYSNGDKSLRKQAQTHVKINIFSVVDTVFNEHLSVLMTILVLGILVHSVYIFSMVCLFGYLFTHLLIKYRNSMQKLHNSQSTDSFMSKLFKILPKFWIIALFISYWSDNQYA